MATTLRTAAASILLITALFTGNGAQTAATSQPTAAATTQEIN